MFSRRLCGRRIATKMSRWNRIWTDAFLLARQATEQSMCLIPISTNPQVTWCKRKEWTQLMREVKRGKSLATNLGNYRERCRWRAKNSIVVENMPMMPAARTMLQMDGLTLRLWCERGELSYLQKTMLSVHGIIRCDSQTANMETNYEWVCQLRNAKWSLVKRKKRKDARRNLPKPVSQFHFLPDFIQNAKIFSPFSGEPRITNKSQQGPFVLYCGLSLNYERSVHSSWRWKSTKSHWTMELEDILSRDVKLTMTEGRRASIWASRIVTVCWFDVLQDSFMQERITFY